MGHQKRLVQDVATQKGLDLSHPRLEQIDMAYHDVNPHRGLFHLLARRGRATSILTEEQISQAMTTPPLLVPLFGESFSPPHAPMVLSALWTGSTTSSQDDPSKPSWSKIPSRNRMIVLTRCSTNWGPAEPVERAQLR